MGFRQLRVNLMRTADIPICLRNRFDRPFVAVQRHRDVIGREQLVSLRESRVSRNRAGQQIPPGVELGTQSVGLPEDLLGAALVVPEPGLDGPGVELRDA